jgi:hypothetical protein
MLKNEVFIDKIADLMAWYVNFQFRLYDIDSKTQAKSPSLQYQVWYKAFKDFSDEDFSVIVDGYMKENVYPPSSPTSLLEYAKTILVQQNKGNIDKVWVDLKTMIAQYGFKSFKGWSVSKNDFVYTYPLRNSIKNYGDTKLEKVFERMYSKLQNLNSNNEDFVRKEFFEEYERLIIEEVRSNVNQGKLSGGEKENQLKLKEK